MIFLKKFYIYIIVLFLLSIAFSNQNSNKYEYISGEDGIIRFRVNVIGHVKSPGSYLVYDGCDLITALSYAGGPLEGSKLDEVMIYSQTNEPRLINLSNILDDDDPLNNFIVLHPNDTIYLEQTKFNYFINNSRFLNTILQFINLYINITE